MKSFNYQLSYIVKYNCSPITSKFLICLKTNLNKLIQTEHEKSLILKIIIFLSY